MKEIRSFLGELVQMGHARWVDPQHIEVIQPHSCRHLRHFVTQEAETLVWSGFGRVTKVSSPFVTLRHPTVTQALKALHGAAFGADYHVVTLRHLRRYFAVQLAGDVRGHPRSTEKSSRNLLGGLSQSGRAQVSLAELVAWE